MHHATDRDNEVVTLVRKRYNQAKPEYVQSDEFLELIRVTQDKICDDLQNKYVHVKDFVTELKAYGAKLNKKKTLKRPADSDTERTDHADCVPQVKRLKTTEISGTEESDASAVTVQHSRTNGRIASSDCDESKSSDTSLGKKSIKRNSPVKTAAPSTSNHDSDVEPSTSNGKHDDSAAEVRSAELSSQEEETEADADAGSQKEEDNDDSEKGTDASEVKPSSKGGGSTRQIRRLEKLLGVR